MLTWMLACASLQCLWMQVGSSFKLQSIDSLCPQHALLKNVKPQRPVSRQVTLLRGVSRLPIIELFFAS